MIEIRDQEDYNELKEILKKSPSIKSKHKIIGEWNFNSIKDIEHFGVYFANTSTFSEDFGYLDGKAYLEYLTSTETNGTFVLDGEIIENTVYNSFYSLYDCFLPFRPSAGVVYPMANSPKRKFIGGSVSDSAPIAYPIGIDQLDNLPGTGSPFAKTYLPHKDIQYRYWTSASYGVKNNLVPGMTGVKNLDGSSLKNNSFNDYEFITTNNTSRGKPHPFVVYDSDFYCNTITVKYQTHLGVPNRFYIDVLQGNQWVQVFSSEEYIGTGLMPEQHSDGVLKIFRDSNGDWAPVENKREFPSELVDFLTEGKIRYLPDGSTKLSSFDDEAIKIRGLRLRVVSMTKVNCPFELIELSPRLAVDLTDYTISFSCNTSIGDGTSSLPTGNLVIGSGEIALSNTDGGFSNDNQLSILYQSIGKGVKIAPYQTIELSDGSEYQIPIKVLYVDSWVESPDYIATATLYDLMKNLQSQKCSPIMISTLFKSVPVSFAVQSVLHSVGITDFKFLDSDTQSNENIKYFYADDDKTIAEVLNEISNSTQCAIYIDAFNNVVCASKDKVLDRSYQLDGKEPQWWLTTEDISVEESTQGEGSDAKKIYTASSISSLFDSIESQISSLSLSPDYISNISSMTKNDTEPLNDGDIIYTTKTFQVRKDFSSEKTDKLSREDPLKLTTERYQLKIKGLWSASGNGGAGSGDSDALLFGGMILSKLSDVTLTQYGTRAVKENYLSSYYSNFQEYLSVKILNDKKVPNHLKLFKISPMDANWFLRPFNGYLRVNQEIIRYNGVEFSIGRTRRWIFDEEQYENFRASAGPKSQISATGRVGIWMEFDEENPVIRANGEVSYSIIDDGRGQFSTRVTAHDINKYESEDKNYINGWEMDASYFCNTETLASTKNSKKVNTHKIEKTKSKLLLGSTNSQSIKDYSGYIKRSGLLISGSEGRQLTSENSLVKAVAKFVKDDIKDRELEKEENYDDTLRIVTTGDLIAQGIYKKFTKKFDSFYTSFSFLSKKGRSNKEAVSATNAAGMAVHYNSQTGEGYFVEIGGTVVNEETDDVRAQVVVYKVKRSGNNNLIYVLGRKVIEGNVFENVPVFGELDSNKFKSIAVKFKKSNQFVVYVDNLKVLSIEDKKDEAVKPTNDALLFVRGDTAALFDKFTASSEPINNNSLFLYDSRSTTFKLTDDYYNQPSIVKYPADSLYVEEFGDNIYQVKKFRFKYTDKPSPIYDLADLTPVGAEYFIEDYDLHPFGGEIVVSNASGSNIGMTDDSKNALMVLGVPLTDYAEQKLSVRRFIDDLPSTSGLKESILSSIRKNGSKSFSIKGEYIQTEGMARKIMEWVMLNTNKPKIEANVEIFCNPLLELTDTIKIYSPRNNIDQSSFYTITGISYLVGNNGPSVSLEVREIGRRR